MRRATWMAALALALAAAPAHPVQAVVDVKYLSYEPAARLQRSGA